MLVNYGNSQRFASSIRRAHTHAETAVSRAAALYESGLIDHLALLDAQREKNRISDLEVVSRLQTVNAVVSLYKALGGSWETQIRSK